MVDKAAAPTPCKALEGLQEGAQALGIPLDSRALERFTIYLRELMAWNQTRNLTAIREPAAIVSRHFLDALTCASGYDFSIPRPVLDVGSGAGFPGLPLKIAFPSVTMALMDSSIKKIEFLNHLCPLLGFRDVDVVHARAEELGHSGSYRQKFHLVLARGLASLPVLVELCLPYVTVGGYLLAQKGPEISDELEQAGGAIASLGGGDPELLEVEIPGTGLRHALVRIRKEEPTPSRFPRRPGIPAKRPLGSSPDRTDHPKYR